ncbi:hypothetical protein R6Q57_002555 [Mikania cordata]
MGNQTSNDSRRLILSDGTVHEYKEPVTVAELMLEHPQQAVVEFQPAKKKTKPLPADFKLESNKVYLMVPIRRGKPMAPTISSEEAQLILLRTKAILKTGSFVMAYTGFIPVFARMCPAVVVNTKKKAKPVENSPTMDTKPELFVGRDDGYYMSRQLSGKISWKPSLDTIKEKSVKAKIRHWLL